jgi:uracil-DNA glycosylase
MSNIDFSSSDGLAEWVEASPMMHSGEHLRLLDQAYKQTALHPVFPFREDVFNALRLTPLSAVKVVILGQDPYFNEYPGLGCEAHGLAFSVRNGFPVPPSLRNIFKEINRSLYDERKNSFPSDLSRWAEQGVLLLNATLTVEKKKPNSHRKLGWLALTDELISIISQKKHPVVFLLWGGFAQKKARLIDSSIHTILTTSHPSPLSAYRGFLGSDIFAKCNAALMRNGIPPVQW